MNSILTCYLEGVHQVMISRYNGARGLEEEKSRGLEIGSRGSISEISYEIAYFRTKIKDMIAVPSLASGLGDNATNIGEALIDGVNYSYRKTSMMVVLSLCPLPLLRLLQMLNSKPQQVYMLKIATQGGNIWQ